MNVFSVYLGDAKPMNLKVLAKDCDNMNPFDLSAADEIDVALPKQDGTLLHLLLSEDEVVVQSPAVLGRMTVAISSANSALLLVGVLQTFTVTITIGSEKQTVTYPNALSVLEIV